MFNIEDSETIHVSSGDYTLQNGNKYNIEYSVYYSENEKDFPFLFMEEAFNSEDIQIPLKDGKSYTKTKEIAFKLLNERKKFMQRKSINRK